MKKIMFLGTNKILPLMIKMVQNGYKVCVYHSSGDLLDATISETKKNVLDENKLENVYYTLDINEVKNYDVIIEAISDTLEEKEKIFLSIQSIGIGKSSILVTNTSNYSVTKISRFIKNKANFVGINYIVSPKKTNIVEIVRAVNTSSVAISQLQQILQDIKVDFITVNDTPGFVVNFLFCQYVNMALEAYSENLATPEVLDMVIRMGLGYPMGFFELLDSVGLDDYLQLTSDLFNWSHNNFFAPHPVLQCMVDGGKYGKKNKRGFYEY